MQYKGYVIRPVDPGHPEQYFIIHPPHRPRKILAEKSTVRDSLDQIDQWELQLSLFPEIKKYG